MSARTEGGKQPGRVPSSAPLSTSYAVLDAAGVPVSTGAEFERLLRDARSLRAAVVIVGCPSGAVLAHVLHEIGVAGTHVGDRAAARWRRANGVHATAAEGRTGDVQRLRTSGLSTPQIAAQLGISHTSVLVALRAGRAANKSPASSIESPVDMVSTAGPCSSTTRGIRPRKPRAPADPRRMERVVALRREGMTARAIAAELGVHLVSVVRAIRQARDRGIEVPGRKYRRAL
jgi:transposase